MGVRAAVGAALGAALAGRGAGEETVDGAAPALAVGAARLGALVRGAGAELGGAGFAAGAAGRGATIGRAAAPLLGALPGIIGRGGKSSGRPPAGPAGGAAGLAIGLFSTTAARWASGTTLGIAVGADVGPFGTGGDVSSMAAARAAFARCATIASASSVVRPALGADEFEENSSSIDDPADTVITPPQTEHRARTIVDGTFAGSTRKTERHSGQETFTCPPSRSICRDARWMVGSCSVSHPCADQSRRRSREESSHSSSFQLQVHSLAPRA